MKNLFILFLLCCANILGAQTYLQEYFNYGSAADTLCGNGGVTTNWTPHAAAGSNPVMYQNSGTSYSGYSGGSTSSGSLQFVNGTGTRESVNTAVPGISSGVVYLSFLLKISTGGGANTLSDYFLHFNDTFGSSLSSNAIGRIFIQNVMLVPSVKFGLSKGSTSSGAVFTSTQYSLGTTCLIVMKYIFRTGSSSDDSVYAWMFGSGVPATEPAPQLVASDMSVADLPMIRSVCIRQGSIISTTVTIDAMRLGTSWGNTVLPVQLLDLSAKPVGKNEVLLKWSTASGLNNDHFEVERSTDQSQWTMPGKVKGNGSTNTITNYQFTDNVSAGLSKAGIVYYRLKQIDRDGGFQYSKTVSVDLNLNEDIILLQNPFKDMILLRHHFAEPRNVQFEVYDPAGKKVYMQNMRIDPAVEELKLEVGALLPKGIYFLKVDDRVIKLLKE